MSAVTGDGRRASRRLDGLSLSPTAQIGVLFFFSGFAALLYQLIWQRSLFRILGVNIEAVTIVVTAFMVGLGLGSLAGGFLSRRLEGRAIAVLAAIEAVTAAFGAFSLSIFEAAGAAVAGADLPVVAGVALGLVIVPTLLMGATLPILVAHMARATGLTGQAVGYLYYVNTIGAAVACAAAALFVFPFVGMQTAVLLAVSINVLVSLFAIRLHMRGAGCAGRPGVASARPPAGARGPVALSMRASLALAALGGFASLSYEIFLVRVLSFSTGGLAYSFALTLAAFLVGVASGSRVAGEMHAMPESEQSARIRRELAIAVAAGALILPALRWLGVTGALQAAIVLSAAFLIARATGLVLPWVAQHGVAADADTGVKVSWLYLANIAGSASGSILTGFVLMNILPLAAIAQVLAIFALVLLLAFAWITRAPRQGVLAVAVAAAAGVAAAPLLAAGLWDRLLHKEKAFAASPVVEIVENRSGVIAVTADGVVYGNGMYDGRFNTDLTNDENGVARPFVLSLLHAAPKRVLMIGLSSGSWARIIASNPHVESLTIVELNPGYVELASRHPETRSILTDPRINLVADDGRRWLAARPNERFDAVVQNTTFNFRANVSNLLSREYLALVFSSLAPGGVFFYNATGSNRVQRAACAFAPAGLRFMNHMALPKDGLAVDFTRWRRTLLDYRIDGRAVLDPGNPRSSEALADLMSMQDDWRTGRGPAGAMETCASILDRTEGLAPITDDNMGTEWRYPLGLE